MSFAFTVNGAPVEVEATGSRRLLDVLREDLGLTGTKEGCGEGECGACSVLLNGEVVDACLVPVSQARGASVTTVEGLGAEDRLSVLQQAFLETGGAQCGICTPGMILAAAPLKPGATLQQIKTALAGNLCRCTGYPAIFRSVDAALNKKKVKRARAR